MHNWERFCFFRIMNNPITLNDYLRASCHLLEHGFLYFYSQAQLDYWRGIIEEYEASGKKRYIY